ncbi:uncharacterized protein LOC123534886 [Mercenaria mercenaria]|uniref:uncharacterized protein LOC123534886 n=1 Tax=Mercenaria mercenaria TaxID=6596 RepID=UPI00234F835C|nr:uncharacterized protein LOC123534886 [Mercenaria mercenaria]
MERSIASVTLAFSIAGAFLLDHTPPALHSHDHSPPGHHPPDHTPPDPHLLDHSPPDPHLHEHHDCHGPECKLIDEAIYNIGMYLDDHLCHVFKEVNCSYHILTNDEQICGSDGRTYANHCLYVKARCAEELYDSHYNANPLGIANHGPCVSSTVPVATTVSSSPEMSAIITGSGNTITTAMSLQNVLGSVFCKNRWSIDCGQDIAIVCGSDGNNYPNECELLKWQCENPTLRKESDSSVCESS